MKKNYKNIVGVLLVAGLGVMAWWLVANSGNTSLKKDESDFAYADTAAITKIFLADKTGKKVTLTRAAGKWLVNGEYTARRDAIDNLLESVHGVRPKSPVGDKAKETIIKWLATGAIKIEIYKGDACVKAYYIGGATQDNLGTYMLLADASDPTDASLNAEMPYVAELPGHNGILTPRYLTDAVIWRDRTVFNLIPPQIAEVKIEHNGFPDQSFILKQPQVGTYQLSNLSGQPLAFDEMRLKQYLTYFIGAQYEGPATELEKKQRDSILRSVPEKIITVTDVNKKNYTVKMFRKAAPKVEDTADGRPELAYDPDRAFAWLQVPQFKADDPNNFVLVQYPVFGKILMTPRYFTPGSDAEMPFQQPAIVEQRLKEAEKKQAK